MMVAAAVACALVLPEATGAQEPDPAETERRLNEVRAQSGQVELQVDALEAQDAEIRSAIATLEANVATQQAELDEAERALASAEAEVATAEQNVATAQENIDALETQTDDLVVEAFVNPESDSALEGFKADTMSDLMVRRALTEIQADSDADVLDQLEQAHEDLAVEQADKERAAEAAEEKRSEADAALADVTNALTQQQEFGADIEERLNAKLAEAESLRTFDAALADQLVREQAEVARRLREAQEAAARQAAAEAAAAAAAQAQAQAAAAARAQAPAPSSGGGGGGGPAPSVVSPAPGGLATVTCPYGGSVRVAASIAGNVQALLDLAAAQGVSLCAASGWRSPEQQIQLRREHCGTSYYAIYLMPSSQCSPPTARPGTSMHERGLAIDFSCNGGGAVRRGNSCWNFLATYANSYGLYNLPSEPWHWSTTGS